MSFRKTNSSLSSTYIFLAQYTFCVPSVAAKRFQGKGSDFPHFCLVTGNCPCKSGRAHRDCYGISDSLLKETVPVRSSDPLAILSTHIVCARC